MENQYCSTEVARGEGGGGRGVGYSVIWTMRGFAAGQGMVFVLSVLNKVYNLTRVGPIHCKSCLLSVRVLCPKQGNKILLFCLTRVCILRIVLS